MGWVSATIVGMTVAAGLAAAAPGAVFAQTPGQAATGCFGGAPQKSTKAFVEAYNDAKTQLISRDFAAAASAADTAAAAAVHDNEKTGVENIRFAAYVGSHDKARAAATLQALKDIGCLSPDAAERAQATIDGLDR